MRGRRTDCTLPFGQTGSTRKLGIEIFLRNAVLLRSNLYAAIAAEHYNVNGAINNNRDIVYVTENQSTFYKHMNRCFFQLQ